MPKTLNPPCIRGLKRFEKSGCPQKAWDGQEGCPCWIEMAVATKGNPAKKEIRKQCLDLWLWEFQWAMLGLLEGNQQATESFRNAMVETGPDGKDAPKGDPAIRHMVGLLAKAQKVALLQKGVQKLT